MCVKGRAYAPQRRHNASSRRVDGLVRWTSLCGVDPELGTLVQVANNYDCDSIHHLQC